MENKKPFLELGRALDIMMGIALLLTVVFMAICVYLLIAP